MDQHMLSLLLKFSKINDIYVLDRKEFSLTSKLKRYKWVLIL